jgi:hypothetical protein
MKKVLLLAAFGVAGMMSAKVTVKQNENYKLKNHLWQHDMLWSYLYQSTCGTYFTVSINKPIGDLNAGEQQQYNENLAAQNASACSPKPEINRLV